MPPASSQAPRHTFASAGPPRPGALRPAGAPRHTTSRTLNDAVIRRTRPPVARPRTMTGRTMLLVLRDSGLSLAVAYAQFGEGVLAGLGDSLKSAWSLVSHDLWQGATYTELVTTVTALGMLDPYNLPGSLAAAQAFDRRWGTHIAQRQGQILTAIHQLIRQIPHWTPRQWGHAVGRLVGDAVLAKGAGAAFKAAGSVGGLATQVAKTNVASWKLGSMGAGAAAKTVLQKLPTVLTDGRGYFIGPLTVRTPLSLRVQRFGLMSLSKPDYWGPRTFGTSQAAARRLNAIIPSWNNLSLYTEGTIPRGTPLRVGIAGSQGWPYPGGLYQVEVESRAVVGQASKILPPSTK